MKSPKRSEKKQPIKPKESKKVMNTEQHIIAEKILKIIRHNNVQLNLTLAGKDQPVSVTRSHQNFFFYRCQNLS